MDTITLKQRQDFEDWYVRNWPSKPRPEWMPSFTCYSPLEANALFAAYREGQSSACAVIAEQRTVKVPELPPLPEWSKCDDFGGLVPSEVRQEFVKYGKSCIAEVLRMNGGA